MSWRLDTEMLQESILYIVKYNQHVSELIFMVRKYRPEESPAINTCLPDGTFPKSSEFISYIYLMETPWKVLGMEKQNIQCDWNFWSMTFKRTNQIYYCQFSQDDTAEGFLWVWEATLTACDHPLAICNAVQCLTKLVPYPVSSDAKTCFH